MAGGITLYKCEKCGNVYEKVHRACGCDPVCCGQTCSELEAKTADPDEQKHVPWIEKQDGGYLVRVGKNAPHPMDPDHYIVFIELCADGILMRRYLKPGDKPEAFFPVKADKVVAWEYCNKHGYWKSQRGPPGEA
ncbi:desulfoferrodoxin family protein [Methanomassiliicoccaceae archaeon COG_1]|nr:desulfoferrodoxin family protein [Methanomassiliicoccaceae archaeon COG_1]